MIEEFVKAGDLVFDIGANKGDFARRCVNLGAEVIAVEPQEEHAQNLQMAGVRHVQAAVSDAEGEIDLYTSERTVFTSIYESWVDGHPGGKVGTIRVPTVTLDGMIRDYGEPAFVKIDTEGHEHKVLAGLTRRLPALSFEYHGGQYPRLLAHDPVPDCFALLEGYRFRFAEGETRWASGWLSAQDALEALPGLSWGDVYATIP